VYEPIHGSAPQLAGSNIANPAGAIASAVLMLDELGLGDAARLLSNALDLTLVEGCRTRDLDGTATCSEFGERVRSNLAAGLVRSGAYRELIAMNRGCCG
jgi:3-isopropylmalate dehydrogenase